MLGGEGRRIAFKKSPSLSFKNPENRENFFFEDALKLNLISKCQAREQIISFSLWVVELVATVTHQRIIFSQRLE